MHFEIKYSLNVVYYGEIVLIVVTMVLVTMVQSLKVTKLRFPLSFSRPLIYKEDKVQEQISTDNQGLKQVLLYASKV